MSGVIYKELSPPPINRREILRYMKCAESTKETDALVERCLAEASDKLTYKVCYCRLPIVRRSESLIDFSFATVESRDVTKYLDRCNEIILMSATVGIEIDRLILKYSRLSPSSAVCMQAIGAERIEALCDSLCDELKSSLKQEGKTLKPRFSPGYGDVPLDLQSEFISLLSADRYLGITKTDAQLLSPHKTVSAFVGINRKE